MATKVCISIDTEFSIAGAFGNRSLLPVAEQRVWCKVNNKSHGLGFILDCFAKYEITGTFFVEALNRHYFKHDPMRQIAENLHAAGHDIQLHLHPCWRVFLHEDWRRRACGHALSSLDSFFRRSEDDSLCLIEDGLQAFREWQLPVPTVFRSGGLQHDEALYRARARAGIPYSSHIGVAIFDSGDARFRLYSGRHELHGVTECPTLTFRDWQVPGKEHFKTLTITGSSFAETRMLLEQAHQEGIEQVVILTHPFEYVLTRDHTLRQMRRHRVNQRRLARLCEFLNQNRDRFPTCGIAAAASAPKRPGSMRNVLLKGSLLRAVPRIVEQAAYEKYGQWRLGRQHVPALVDVFDAEAVLDTAAMSE